jgi:hypothetical protein
MNVTNLYFKYNAINARQRQEERNKLISEFNDPDSDVMLLLITNNLGSVSLNLQAACHHIYIMEIPISYNVLIQILGRVNRIGQKHEQFIKLLFVYDTFDQFAMHRLFRKIMPILAGEGDSFTDEDPIVDAENKLMMALGLPYSFLHEAWASPPWNKAAKPIKFIEEMRKKTGKWLYTSDKQIRAQLDTKLDDPLPSAKASKPLKPLTERQLRQRDPRKQNTIKGTYPSRTPHAFILMGTDGAVMALQANRHQIVLQVADVPEAGDSPIIGAMDEDAKDDLETMDGVEAPNPTKTAASCVEERGPVPEPVTEQASQPVPEKALEKTPKQVPEPLPEQSRAQASKQDSLATMSDNQPTSSESEVKSPAAGQPSPQVDEQSITTPLLRLTSAPVSPSEALDLASPSLTAPQSKRSGNEEDAVDVPRLQLLFKLESIRSIRQVVQGFSKPKLGSVSAVYNKVFDEAVQHYWVLNTDERFGANLGLSEEDLQKTEFRGLGDPVWTKDRLQRQKAELGVDGKSATEKAVAQNVYILFGAGDTEGSGRKRSRSVSADSEDGSISSPESARKRPRLI